MSVTNLRKVGGSIMLAVPPALLDALQLVAGSKVALTVDDGRLVVTPEARPRYTLDDLLAQCDPAVEPANEERDWLGAKPVGHEVP